MVMLNETEVGGERMKVDSLDFLVPDLYHAKLREANFSPTIISIILAVPVIRQWRFQNLEGIL
jgi:hypothetical protein